MQELKKNWHKAFWKIKALEALGPIQSIRRCLAMSDETARRAMLCDDGKGVAGMKGMTDCGIEDDMGDQIIFGDVTHQQQSKPSIAPALAKLGIAAILGSTGLGAAYLAFDYLKSKTEVVETQDTNDVIFFTLDDPK